MRRHDLAYLHQMQSFSVLGVSDVMLKEHIKDMIHQGMPFTVCRQNLPNVTKLAISCMVHGNKTRVAISIDTEPRCITPPLPLKNLCLDRLSRVQVHIDEFIARCEKLGASVHVYGSYANECLTNLSFVHDSSDLDLLIMLNDKNNWALILSAILAFKQTLSKMGINLDGELRVDEDDVLFNELMLCMTENIDSILTKNLTNVRLKKIQDIFKGVADECIGFRASDVNIIS